MSKFAEITKNSFTDFHENRRSMNQFDIHGCYYFSRVILISIGREEKTLKMFL